MHIAEHKWSRVSRINEQPWHPELTHRCTIDRRVLVSEDWISWSVIHSPNIVCITLDRNADWERVRERETNKRNRCRFERTATNQWCLRLVMVNFVPHDKHVSLSPHGGSRVMISIEWIAAFRSAWKPSLTEYIHEKSSASCLYGKYRETIIVTNT